ncbi:hypothetical protein I7I50_01134 [Histoplasma capsulatum G186AR]|uniref:Uncharacterized protein n=1 Tax=Ajellomyces capsulatus TaxID=5037 RepID=A0A8H8D2R1_AJECA|nr:hypothetical protein I7I52_09043 [Histoplasma capsulatum]QSS73097.1 hypothetical protein I7I50_01134 [Histoplasma capsulatum G186AR]
MRETPRCVPRLALRNLYAKTTRHQSWTLLGCSLSMWDRVSLHGTWQLLDFRSIKEAIWRRWVTAIC